MTEDERAELAKRQGELVEALTGGGEVPREFDGGRVSLTARTLVRKRMRAVEKSWPGVARELRERYETLFEEYARACTFPGDAGRDGAEFVGFVAIRGMLGDAARIEWAVWRARRGWPVRVTRVRGRLVVVVRAWRGRLRRFSLPFLK
jgi:hypothetical protein